ncbi:MAG: outer membrane beta-barrel protein [Longimicrobiales bacterium]
MHRYGWFAGIVAGLFAMASPIVAQGSAPILGFKAGVTVATAELGDLDETFDKDNRTGLNAGVFLLLGSNNVLSLQPELNLVTRGFKYSGVSDGDVSLGYLQPAVLLKFGIPLVVVKPGVFAGVGYGFKTTCSLDETECDDPDVDFGVKSSDFTGIFGADVQLGIGETLILIGDARYEVGFSDIDDANDVFSDMKNRAFTIQVGLGLRT